VKKKELMAFETGIKNKCLPLICNFPNNNITISITILTIEQVRKLGTQKIGPLFLGENQKSEVEK